jgi:predicted enzyme related to lactoylglutathione lyase
MVGRLANLVVGTEDQPAVDGRGQPTPEVICVAVRLRVSAALPVSDLALARSFYVDTLGLTPVVEGEDVLAFRCADGTDFGVFVSQGRPSGTHTQVTFFCQSIDAEVADLRARGVQLEEFDMPGPGSRMVSMT